MANFLQFSLLLLLSSFCVDAAIFTLQNNCKKTIWPGILSGGGHPLLSPGGLELKPRGSIKLTAPTGWSGRFWARSGCTFDTSGKGNCVTGDCGNVLQCNGAGGVPPVSLAEFTLNSPMDFYDVSLVDGYNVPVSIVPLGGSGNCSRVTCVSDLNVKCPRSLQVKGDGGEVVACKSACTAFQKPECCCSGAFNDPKICKPTSYSKIFKEACPSSYSYPYDDATSTFTCKEANYLISFC
ncbi:pathogenesis-related thaumatin-like protein 3.5 [Rutidosis leptorrhynchoides]|uniref:pathogenesis-related thaumatin-like protein 3.5 n=1 Tax=Rutidosis leptorrhynchoides TaxID=125765 RepID=UPI003A99B334